MNTYTITLRRSNGTEASFTLAAVDDFAALTNASYRAWLGQLDLGCWPYYRVAENGIDTGCPLTL